MIYLTEKEKKFADAYLETGNGTQSALKTYNTTSYTMAAVIASKNIKKDKVRKYLESKAEVASSVIFDLCQHAQSEAVKLGAGKDILDRAGYKPTDNIDVKTGGEKLNKELTDEDLDRIIITYERNKRTKTIGNSDDIQIIDQPLCQLNGN